MPAMPAQIIVRLGGKDPDGTPYYYAEAPRWEQLPYIAGCARCGIPFPTQSGENVCPPCVRKDLHSPHHRRVRLHDALHAAASEPPHRLGFGEAVSCPRFQAALQLIPDHPIYACEPPAWQTPLTRHTPEATPTIYGGN